MASFVVLYFIRLVYAPHRAASPTQALMPSTPFFHLFSITVWPAVLPQQSLERRGGVERKGGVERREEFRGLERSGVETRGGTTENRQNHIILLIITGNCTKYIYLM